MKLIIPYIKKAQRNLHSAKLVYEYHTKASGFTRLYHSAPPNVDSDRP